MVGGRGWPIECDIEGVAGKVTPVFKYSKPFLSKIVDKMGHSVTFASNYRKPDLMCSSDGVLQRTIHRRAEIRNFSSSAQLDICY